MAYNDWLTINPTSGSGNGVVTATVSSHSGYSTRTKQVRISANDKGVAKEKTVTFTQTGENRAGFATVMADGSTITRPSVRPEDLRSKSSWQFHIDGTNAYDFQYFVEVVAGNITKEELNGILSEPTLIDTQIIDVKSGITRTLDTFKVTDETYKGKIKTVYSMDATNFAKKYGENQTYSIHINATPGTYTNTSSEDVTVRYGLAVEAGISPYTISELTSFTVTYPAVGGFSVDGGGTISSVSSSYPINITAQTGVTWTAQIV
jgi:hypothetical protein